MAWWLWALLGVLACIAGNLLIQGKPAAKQAAPSLPAGAKTTG